MLVQFRAATTGLRTADKMKISELKTEAKGGPMSGEVTFRANAEIDLRPHLSVEYLKSDLEALS